MNSYLKMDKSTIRAINKLRCNEPLQKVWHAVNKMFRKAQKRSCNYLLEFLVEQGPPNPQNFFNDHRIKLFTWLPQSPNLNHLEPVQ